MSSPVSRFVVLFQGRAGSSYLIDALKRHPDVKAGDEILRRFYETEFRPRSVRGRLREGVTHIREGCLPERQIRAARRFWEEVPDGVRVVGFKTKLRQVWNPVALKGVLEEGNVRTVVLRRNNLVKQAISTVIGFRVNDTVGSWNVRDPSRRPGPQEIPLADFDRFLKGFVYDDRVLAAFGDFLDVPKLRLEYEDLLKDRESWLREVLEFLEVEHRPLESDIVKAVSDDLRSAVTNFDELRRHYVGTRFEGMFDEVTRS